MRVASTYFTPEHNIDGRDVSAKLQINAFMNIASKANGGKGRSEVVPFTIWGKMAHICAKSMSPGKEFHCDGGVKVYDGNCYYKSEVKGTPGEQIFNKDGSPVKTKKMSFTIGLLIFGEEGNNHILAELNAKNADGSAVRPADWNVQGSPGQAMWKEVLKARSAVQFDANSVTYGYATVRMPRGAFAPYQGGQKAATTADTTQAVVSTFAGVNPAGTVPVAAPKAAPTVNATGFVVKGV
jgi:hypothetical protein